MTHEPFREAMSRWASGVAVVTAEAEGFQYGLTVSSFTSVSLAPPLILVCLGTQNYLPGLIEQAGCFGVSLLQEGQSDLALKFSTKGRKPARQLPGVFMNKTGQTSVPILSAASTGIACAVHDLQIMGDHTIVVGRVLDVALQDQSAPLIYYSREFGTVAKTEMVTTG